MKQRNTLYWCISIVFFIFTSTLKAGGLSKNESLSAVSQLPLGAQVLYANADSSHIVALYSLSETSKSCELLLSRGYIIVELLGIDWLKVLWGEIGMISDYSSSYLLSNMIPDSTRVAVIMFSDETVKWGTAHRVVVDDSGNVTLHTLKISEIENDHTGQKPIRLNKDNSVSLPGITMFDYKCVGSEKFTNDDFDLTIFYDSKGDSLAFRCDSKK